MVTVEEKEGWALGRNAGEPHSRPRKTVGRSASLERRSGD